MVTLIALMIYKKKRIYFILVVLLLFILTTYISYDKVLLPALKIPAGSVREAAICTISTNSKICKKNMKKKSALIKKKKIDKVLGYETLKERYNPNLADPVKKSV